MNFSPDLSILLNIITSIIKELDYFYPTQISYIPRLVAQNWHKKETHGVPGNSVVHLYTYPPPVSRAVFLKLRHRALRHDASRIDTVGRNPCASKMVFLLKTQ